MTNENRADEQDASPTSDATVLPGTVTDDAKQQPLYPNTQASAHVLPDVLAPILGGFVEGGIFELAREDSDGQSGLTITSDIAPGGVFDIYVAEWRRDENGVHSDTLMAMSYNWDGDFLVTTTAVDEDEAVDFLHDVVVSSNLMVRKHKEVTEPDG